MQKKEIDIQSYGSTGNTVKDMNTTYLLSDLLTFSENGGLAALKAAVQKASAIENRQEAGELLDGQSDTLETIRPVTGITLSECSRWYSDSASFVFNTYVRLAQVCEDIAARYQQYTDGEQSLWSENAPSNLRYCIENTATGDLYTNFGAESYDAGAEILQERPEYTMLYEGERSYNIMVANQDNVLNAEAEAWFLNDRFVSTNEKVLLAIDQSYPVNDELRTYADYFANRETIVWVSATGIGISGVFLLICFVLSLVGAGLEEGRLAPRIYAVDKVPTELAAGIYAVLVMLIVIFLNWKWHSRRICLSRNGSHGRCLRQGSGSCFSLPVWDLCGVCAPTSSGTTASAACCSIRGSRLLLRARHPDSFCFSISWSSF